MKHKPGQIALDAIDASLVEARERVDCFTQRNSLPIEKKVWKRRMAELRAWRRVIVAAGKAHVTETEGGDNAHMLDYEENGKLARAILKARRIEGRRK